MINLLFYIHSMNASGMLSFDSRKYRLFRGGIRVLEITLIYFTLDSLSSTFCVLYSPLLSRIFLSYKGIVVLFPLPRPTVGFPLKVNIIPTVG